MTASASELGEHYRTAFAPKCARCGRPVCCDLAHHHRHAEPEQCMTVSRQRAALALAAHYECEHRGDAMATYLKLAGSDAWWG